MRPRLRVLEWVTMAKEEHFIVAKAQANAEQIQCLRKVIESLVSALGGTIDWDECSVSGVSGDPPP